MGTEYTRQFINFLGVDVLRLSKLEEVCLGQVLSMAFKEVAERTMSNAAALFWTDADRSTLQWKLVDGSGMCMDEIDDLITDAIPELHKASDGTGVVAMKAFEFLKERSFPGVSKMKLDTMLSKV